MELLQSIGVFLRGIYDGIETFLAHIANNQQQGDMASVYDYCVRLSGKSPSKSQVEGSSQAGAVVMPRAKPLNITKITHAIPINVLHEKKCQFCLRKFSYLRGREDESCGAPLQFKCEHVSCRECIERSVQLGMNYCGDCAARWELPTFDIPLPHVRKDTFRNISEARDLEEAIDDSQDDSEEQNLIHLKRDNKTHSAKAPSLRYRTTVIQALAIVQTLAADANYKPIDPKYSHSHNGCIFYPDKNKSLSPVPNNGAYKIGIAAFIYFNALIPNTLPPAFKGPEDTEVLLRAVWYALERIPSTCFDTHREILAELSYGTWCAFRKITGLEMVKEGGNMDILRDVLGKCLQLGAEFGRGFEGVSGEFRAKPHFWLELFGGVNGEGY
jgi:hypothetical protein